MGCRSMGRVVYINRANGGVKEWRGLCLYVGSRFHVEIQQCNLTMACEVDRDRLGWEKETCTWGAVREQRIYFCLLVSNVNEDKHKR